VKIYNREEVLSSIYLKVTRLHLTQSHCHTTESVSGGTRAAILPPHYVYALSGFRNNIGGVYLLGTGGVLSSYLK